MTLPNSRPLLIVSGLACVALLVAALWSPELAGAGWLTGFLFASAVPAGSLGWLLIHRLTGGHWGAQLSPALKAASNAMPAVIILALPLLAGIGALYPWALAANGDASSVHALFLNGPLFAGRTPVILIGLTIFALLPRAMWRRHRVVLAATGLVFYGVSMTFAGVDWILALAPPFMSTSAGVTLIAVQLLAALAFAALIACPAAVTARRDLAGLMLALCLAVLYLNFMAFVVLWYGDVPLKIAWLARRGASPWQWLTIVALLLGTILPSFALMFAKVRGSRPGLRIVASSILSGLALYDVVLIAPQFGVLAIGTAALATAGMSCLLLAWQTLPWTQRSGAGAAHG